MKVLARFAAVVAVAMSGSGGIPVQAIELLPNGGLENGAGPKGWSLSTTVTGIPGQYGDATEQLDFANNPFPGTGLGIYTNTFAGNINALQDQNKMLNFLLSQTTSATAGRSYTLKADIQMQGEASTFLTTLEPDSPSGAIPSPANSYLTIEFLDSASPVPNLLWLQFLDLRTDTVAPDVWQTHTITTAPAPAGTTQARVTAVANNMVDSCGFACFDGHNLYLDNFSLKEGGQFAPEKLVNGSLDAVAAPTGFTVTSTVNDNYQFSTKDYGFHNGATGMWLRAFQGGDATISSTVAALAGAQYTFSAWSKWEPGYRGGDPTASCQNFLELAFLNDSGSVIGSPVSLDLRTVQLNDETWRRFSLPTTTAPVGTASVRVSAIATGMVQEQGPKLSAMWDDFSLTLIVPPVPGDYNGDGTVNAADYTVWRNNVGQPPGTLINDTVGGPIGRPQFALWKAMYGATILGAGAFSNSVREPGLVVLSTSILILLTVARRRNN